MKKNTTAKCIIKNDMEVGIRIGVREIPIDIVHLEENFPMIGIEEGTNGATKIDDTVGERVHIYRMKDGVEEIGNGKKNQVNYLTNNSLSRILIFDNFSIPWKG